MSNPLSVLFTLTNIPKILMKLWIDIYRIVKLYSAEQTNLLRVLKSIWVLCIAAVQMGPWIVGDLPPSRWICLCYEIPLSEINTYERLVDKLCMRRMEKNRRRHLNLANRRFVITVAWLSGSAGDIGYVVRSIGGHSM